MEKLALRTAEPTKALSSVALSRLLFQTASAEFVLVAPSGFRCFGLDVLERCVKPPSAN
ncbi:hypothetical protein AAHH84_00140 [Candidatus Hodgkinia cicadicola]